VALNMLKAYTAAYHAIKEIQPEAQVGYATHHLGLEPAAPALIHRYAVGMVENFFNQSFALALRDGVLRMAGQRAVAVKGARGALDWIGLQYYQVFKVGFHLLSPASFFLRQYPPADARRRGPPGWGGIDAAALLRHLKWFEHALHKPIYITECGVPDPDDTIRPGHLIESVLAAWRAVNFNVPVRGLYVWTLLDNFEWERGYDPAYSFGLYKTNFETQERTARRSAELYAAICKQNGMSREIVARFAPELLERLYPGTPGAETVTLRPPRPLGTPTADKRSTRP
jgi:beta-glucosidase